MKIKPSMQKLIALLALTGLVAACDSTVGTTANPDLSTITTGYNGPPARTADIRSFELNFWNALKEEDRCGQCHGAGQAPESLVCVEGEPAILGGLRQGGQHVLEQRQAPPALDS